MNFGWFLLGGVGCLSVINLRLGYRLYSSSKKEVGRKPWHYVYCRWNHTCVYAFVSFNLVWTVWIVTQIFYWVYCLW